MIATASGAMLAGVAEAEPDRFWFGKGGCVERHGDGTHAVFVRGEILGIYASDDVATRDMFIAVVMEQASREDLARAFRVSVATVGRVRTRFNEGGARAVADYGRRGGWTVRTPKLVERLVELFEKGLGPRPAHAAVAKYASYGTVHAIYREWKSGKPAATPTVAAPPKAPAQPALSFEGSSEAEEPPAAVAEAPAPVAAPAAATPGEPTLEAVVPATGTVVQHVGSWLLLGGLGELGFHDLAAQHRGDAVAAASLRAAIDATAISLGLGEGSIEGVRRIATPTVDTLLRHAGGVTASWVRRVLHDFADARAKPFAEAMARRLLSRAGAGEDRVFLYVDNHMRPYTGEHVIRKGWRMQDKRAVPGTTDYYVHDEEGCPLYRMSTTSHDSLCAWLMPVVEFSRLSLGEEVTPVLFFDRGGALRRALRRRCGSRRGTRGSCQCACPSSSSRPAFTALVRLVAGLRHGLARQKKVERGPYAAAGPHFAHANFSCRLHRGTEFVEEVIAGPFDRFHLRDDLVRIRADFVLVDVADCLKPPGVTKPKVVGRLLRPPGAAHGVEVAVLLLDDVDPRDGRVVRELGAQRDHVDEVRFQVLNGHGRLQVR